MRLLIVGGGTGGHLFPALAVARVVKKERPTAKILFVGTRHGIEARIIPQTDFPIRFITARGLRKTGFFNTVRGALELPVGIFQSLSIVRGFRPDVVLGVGGYASGPTLAAAVLMRIPTAIQEQNSVMGTTNRFLARLVDRIFTSWEHTEPAPPREKTIVAGNPVREDILLAESVSKAETRFNLLIFGGSGGARSINLAVAQNAEKLAGMADRIRILHQTGQGMSQTIKQYYDRAGIEADVREFIDDMGPAYRWADLVVSRSGASSLAEITAMGKPAIVVPYPFAIGNHQDKNARVLEAGGAVRVVPDAKLKNGALVSEICSVVADPGLLKSMADSSRALGKPHAARTIALELVKAERSRR